MVRMLFLRDIDVDIEIRCRICGHGGTLPLSEMRRRFGPSYPVLSIAPHFRCSRCGSRDTECAPAPPAPEEQPVPLFSVPEPERPAPVSFRPLDILDDEPDTTPAPVDDDPYSRDDIDLDCSVTDVPPDSLIEDAFPSPFADEDEEETQPPTPPAFSPPVVRSRASPVDDERDELAALRAAIAAAVGDEGDDDDEEPLLLDESVEVREPEPDAGRSVSPFSIRDREPSPSVEAPNSKPEISFSPSSLTVRDPEAFPLVGRRVPEPEVNLESSSVTVRDPDWSLFESAREPKPVFPRAPVEADAEEEVPFPLLVRGVRGSGSTGAEVESERLGAIQGAMSALRDLVVAAADEPPSPAFAPPPAADPPPKPKEAFETTLARLRTLLDLEEAGESATEPPDEGASARSGNRGARLFRKRR